MLLSTIKIVDYDKTTGQILRAITWPDPMEAARYYRGASTCPSTPIPMTYAAMSRIAR